MVPHPRRLPHSIYSALGAEAEHAAERTQDPLGGRDPRQNLGRSGLGEQRLQLRAAVGELPAEDNHQPARVGGRRVAAPQVFGMRRTAGVRAAALPRPPAGGQAVHQVREALKDAAEPAPERGAEAEEMGLAEETEPDHLTQRGDDDADPTGEVGGGGLGRRCECGFHG